MNDARPAPFPAALGMNADESASDGARFSYTGWLAQLKKGDAVLVRNGDIHFPGTISNETACFLLVGTPPSRALKFRRDTGWQTKRQQKRCYRMKLRLVRNEQEFQC